MSTYAARYTQPIWAASGGTSTGFLVAVPSASVILKRYGVTAPAYSDRDKTILVPAGTPIPRGVASGDPGIDALGNLVFYGEWGDGYTADITAGGVTTTVAIDGIAPDPLEFLTFAKPVVGGATGAVPAAVAIPSDESSFTLPLATVTPPTALAGAWLVAMADSVVGANGSNVASWAPALGSNFVQATGSKQPTITRSAIDGHSALTFDGGDVMAQVAGASKTQPNTVLVICRSTDLTNTRRILDGLTGSTAHLVRQNAGNWEISGGTVLVLGVITAGWHALLIQFNGAASAGEIDGATAVTGNAGTQAPTGLTLGATSAQTAQFWTGDLAAVVAIAGVNAGTIASLRLWAQDTFPSLSVLDPTVWPSAGFYDVGLVRVGDTLIRYTGRTAATLTGCTLVVGDGQPIPLGAAVVQSYMSEVPDNAVQVQARQWMALGTLDEQLDALALDAIQTNVINVARPPYNISPTNTGLQNSIAMQAAMADAAADFPLGCTVYIPPAPAPYLFDPTKDAVTGGSITLDGTNVVLYVPNGCVLQATDMGTVGSSALVALRSPGVGCGVILHGKLRGDAATHVGAHGETHHLIHVAGALKCSVIGAGAGVSGGLNRGSGVYVGEDYGVRGAAAYLRPDGVLLEGLWMDDCGREGYAPFNGDNIRIVNVVATNIGRTLTALGHPLSPQRGLGSEPNVTNVLRPEAIRNMAINGALFKDCYGVGTGLLGGQGAIFDNVQYDNVQIVNCGLGAPGTAGALFGDITNLQIGQASSTDNLLGPGVYFNRAISGTIGQIIASHNDTGVVVDDSNGKYASNLKFGQIQAWANTNRAASLATSNGGSIRVRDLDVQGNATSGSVESVRLSTSPTTGGTILISGGRIGKVNEEQYVGISGSPTGGGVILTIEGSPMASLPWNATAAQAQTAAEAVVGVGNVLAIEGPWPTLPIRFLFRGTLGGSNRPQMAATNTLTGGTSPTVVITTFVQGGGSPTYLIATVAGSTGIEVRNVEGVGTGSAGTVNDLATGTVFESCTGTLATWNRNRVTVRKPTAQNIADNVSVPVSSLFFPVVTPGTYAFEFDVLYDTTTANDIVPSLSFTATGASVLWQGDGLVSTATGATGNINRAVVAGNGGATYGGARATGAGAVKVGLTIRGTVVVAATPGVVQLNVRKGANTDTASPADDLTIYDGSAVTYWKIA